MTPTTPLSVTGLTKKFGGLVAVDDVSFDLRSGEMTALIGPNGAGKTTLFNMLSGSSQPTAGRVILSGSDITSLPPHARAHRGMGRTFQIAATFRSMTVIENVRTAVQVAARPSRSPAELLDEVGLAGKAEHLVTALPYGDVKRVELAMAIAGDPQLLLLDEPTAGMAGQDRRELMKFVVEMTTSRKLTLLFTEHDMETVFGIAARILVMSEGKLIADGSPDDIRADPLVRDVYLGQSHA